MTALSLVLAAALSAGNAAFEADAQRGACEIALARLRVETIDKGLATGVLERAMLDDPARFASADAARRACRDVYAAALARQFAAAATNIVRQLGLDAAPTAADDAALGKAVAARFDAAYAAERAAAVAAQARTIAGAVRPREADLETKDDAALRREMAAKVVARQATPVFEENLRYISERLVDPVLADGRREMKRQRDYLSRTRCEAYAPDALARELERNLRQNVAERQAKESDPARAWGVFPGVLKAGVPSAVERRLVGLAARAVDDVTLDVTAESVLKAIAADPAAHRKASESEKAFSTAYSAQLLGEAVEKAGSHAPEGERAAFAAFVRQHAADAALSRAVSARLRREALPKWRAARDEVARTEAARLWPTLADRTWFPSAELADRVAARSDYASAVKRWRETPELSDLARPEEGRAVMDETAAAADRSVAAAFDLARTAIVAQNAILSDAEPGVLREARRRKGSFFRRTPDLKALVGLLTEAVEKAWGERRLSTLWGADGERPANAAEQHAALFPSVRRRIELVAKSILEEMERPEPEEKPEEPPEPTESETPPESLPQTYSIVVERAGDAVRVRLEQGGRPVIERASKATLSDYREAVRAVSDKLGTDILNLK